MADTDPNAAPPVDELARLREFAGAVRKTLALGDEADGAAVLSALGNTTRERDDAKARAASIESAWASEKVPGRSAPRWPIPVSNRSSWTMRCCGLLPSSPSPTRAKLSPRRTRRNAPRRSGAS